MLVFIWVALTLALGVSSCRTGLDSKEAFFEDLKKSLFKFLPQISTVDDGTFEPDTFPRNLEERLALVKKYKANLSKDVVYLPTFIDSVLGLLVYSTFWPFKNASEEIRHNFSTKSAKDYMNSVKEALSFSQSLSADYSEPVTDNYATHDYASVPLYKMEAIDRRSGLPGEVEKSTSEYSSEEPCLQTDSIRGIPGEHFPDYEDIPITTFSCTDRRVRGIYADLETGCQVFHVCWPDRRESFLCPIGTIFNQETLVCDVWCNSNCSLAPLFFETGQLSPKQETSSTSSATEDLHATSQAEMLTTTRVPSTSKTEEPSQATTDYITSRPTTVESTSTDGKNCIEGEIGSSLKFNPIKSRITVYADSVKPTDPESTIRRKRAESVEAKERKMAVASGILQGILKATENIARDARNFIQEIENEKTKRQFQDSGKRPRPKVEAISPVTPGYLHGSQSRLKSLPKINPRFVVRPVSVAAQPVKAQGKAEGIKQFKKLSGSSKSNVPELVIKSLEFVGSVLNDDILPLTRKILIESHAKLSKSKRH